MKTRLLVVVLLVLVVPCFSQKHGQGKIDSLVTLLKTTTQDTAKIKALNAIAYEYRSNDPDTAIYFANEALALATKTNDKTGMVYAYIYKGIATANLGKYGEALKNDTDALKICDQLSGSEKATDKSKIQNLKAWAYSSIANIYDEQGNYTEALKNNFAALKIREETKNKVGATASYNNIGNIYATQGNYPEALKNFFAALKIKEETGDKKSIANSYNNIGSTYYNHGDYPQALKYHLAALKMRQEVGDKRGIASSYNNIGIIHDDQANYPEALKYQFDALKIQEEIGDQQGITFSFDNIGLVYMHENNYDKALNYFLDYLKSSEKIEDNSGIADAYIEIGNIYTKQEKNSDASLYLNKGLLLSKKIGSPDYIKNGYGGLARLDSAQGNFKQALEHYKLYINYRDSLFNEENTKKLVQSQMQYDFDKKESLAKAEQEKKDAIALKELQRQKLVRNGFVSGFAVVLLFAGVFFKQRNRIGKEKKRSDIERKRSEELLLNILPCEVAEELKQTGQCQAKTYSMVTVMFADFKDFTSVSERVSAELLVDEINFCFSAFDNILQKHKVEKIKTVGDSYMCASGLPVLNYTHAFDVVTAAIEIRNFILNRQKEKEAKGEIPFQIRIGIHTGPVVAGIVGVKKFAYDIWGDTVNMASRMESSGEAGKVNISGMTYELVKDKFSCRHRGKIQAKNKGEIDMYFVESII
ncbi:MAG: tetratricopeptide repeat protein [Chitinophagales bacterium]|nr:tetratricopeptide repeat protein [Chitinophagales bacterium]